MLETVKTGGSKMLFTRKIMLSGLLGLCLMATSAEVFAEAAPQNDAQVMEELAKFTDESEKMREAHTLKMKEDHLKYINDLYDMKLAHGKEMNALWKQLKPNDKKGNEAILDQMKDKRKAFKKAEEKFKDEFHDNVLKARHKEFRKTMHKRDKELREKYKN